MTPCMGGWCSKRDQCPNHQTPERRNPVERLCMRGRDGIRLVESTPFRSISIDIFAGNEKETELQ